jgi:hydroxymethylpyrimidine/phosphomethylpyrimidine kinase
VIYHKGDFGKEPMIIVFGENPNDVLKKILKII